MEPQDIIASPEREIVCRAAAGSGKTYVLTHRMAHLIRDRGVDPKSIMALTFTRKASQEMRDRVHAIIGDVASQIRIGTFHAICLSLLMDKGERIGVTENTTVLPPDDSNLVLRHIARNLGLYDKRWKNKWSFKRANRCLDRFYRDEQFDDGTEQQLASAYVQFCLDHSCLDFGLMLKLTQLMFDRHSDILAGEQQTIRHIFVDESQDTDTAQYNLHEYYMRECETAFLVGDLRQTIYTWRGARPDLMLSLHPKAQVVDLPGCRRCTPAIVAEANRIMQPLNEELGVGPVHSLREESGVAVQYIARRIEDASWDNVRTLRDKLGCKWSDIAILARKHDSLGAVADRLGDIPYHRVGSADRGIYQTDDFLDAYADLRSCINPDDPVAELRNYGNTLDCSPEMKIAAALPHWKDRSPGHAFWVDHYGFFSIRDAIRWHTMRDAQDDIGDADEVKLMTVHAAKGLEWRVVIVVDVNEGDLPSAMALREDPEAKEERRIFYVACTRAIDVLMIMYDPTRPSRFIAEHPQNDL